MSQFARALMILTSTSMILANASVPANPREEEPMCVGSGTNVSVIGPTRRNIGQRMSETECARVVSAANSPLVCSRVSSADPRSWKPHHILSGHAFGRYGTSLDDCIELVENSGEGVVCTNTGTYEFRGRKPTIVNDQPYSDRNLLGSSGQQKYCMQATLAVRDGWVCICNGDFCGTNDWIKKNLYDSRTAGRNMSIDACIAFNP